MTRAYPAGYPGFINVGATDIYDNAFRDFSRRAFRPSELGLNDEFALILLILTVRHRRVSQEGKACKVCHPKLKGTY